MVMAMNKESILHQKIHDNLYSLFARRPDMPEYIPPNLRHRLREYQVEALEHFIFLRQEQPNSPNFKHLLFHMATGSGKTSILASLILYLYVEYGYQNFMFFVNSNSIIEKTRLNLLDPSSSKYLFQRERVEANGERIKLELVDVFPGQPAAGTIYLKLTTIHKLHGDLAEPRENAITLEAIKQRKMVMLADEAHHINAATSRNKKEQEDERSWEHTVMKLLNSHADNLLLEFTATIDLTNPAIFDKYKHKIVYQYALEQFMRDGYSKGIYLVHSDEDDRGKMLFASLLSQYRRYVAKEHGIDLKPVILFKSKKIDDSVAAMGRFLDLIQNLTEGELQRAIAGMASLADNSDLAHVYRFYQEADLLRLIRDMQYDFQKEKVIAVHSKNEEDYAKILNTLEHPGNPIRAVFAVEKLNEGWDVLNLYDIVRLQEGEARKLKATNAEAQLIGRGARYCPFRYDGEVSSKRRFDQSASPLRLLEQLYYHTVNDSDYVNGLRAECRKEGILYQELQAGPNQIEVKLKENFKKKGLYKQGFVYVNERVETTKDDYRSFLDYKMDTKFVYRRRNLGVEDLYAAGEAREQGEFEVQRTLFYPDKTLIRKAIQRNPFFTFRNLRQKIPGLSSMEQFIEDPNFLGGCEIYIEVARDRQLPDMTRQEQLAAVEHFLRYVQKKLSAGHSKYKGTRTFTGKPVKEVFGDYTLPGTVLANRATDVSIRTMSGNDWYVYDISVLDRLENSFISEMQLWLEQLKAKYSEVYLIRNEERLKLYDFEQGRGFMPDFVLMLNDGQEAYQVFLEPKGGHLLEKDRWKEEFLEALCDEQGYEVLHETAKVRIVGVKFFTDDPALRQAFRDDFAAKLLDA